MGCDISSLFILSGLLIFGKGIQYNITEIDTFALIVKSKRSFGSNFEGGLKSGKRDVTFLQTV